MAIWRMPLQRVRDQRWEMTEQSDEHSRSPIQTVGYCAGPFEEAWPEYDALTLHAQTLFTRELWNAERDRHLPFRDKYHGNGHVTEVGARQCYLDFELDHQWAAYHSTGVRMECAVCGEWTAHRVRIGDHPEIVLCEAHTTRENVATYLSRPGHPSSEGR